MRARNEKGMRAVLAAVALLFLFASTAFAQDPGKAGLLLAAYTNGDVSHSAQGNSEPVAPERRRVDPTLPPRVAAQRVEPDFGAGMVAPLADRIASLDLLPLRRVRFVQDTGTPSPFLLYHRVGRLTLFVDADLVISTDVRSDRPLVDPSPDHDDTFMAGLAYSLGDGLTVLAYPFMNLHDMGGPPSERVVATPADLARYRTIHDPHRLAVALIDRPAEAITLEAEVAVEFPLDYASTGGAMRLEVQVRF